MLPGDLEIPFNTVRWIREQQRASMDIQQSRPLLCITFFPSVWLDNETVQCLPFRSLKVKVLWRSQCFPCQRIPCELGDLLRRAFPFKVVLGIGEIAFELAKSANNEHVIGSLEGGTGEYEPAVRQDLERSDSAIVCEWPGSGIMGWERWVS